MPRDCKCCGIDFRKAVELSRRQFLAMVSAGAVAVSAKADETEAERFALPADELARWRSDLLARGRPREYSSDRHTDARMHLGGIGTGNFEIGVDGQLTTWQLFNTLRDGQVPFYFAIRAGNTARLLQTAGGPAWPRVRRITMRGDYPIAYLTYRDPDLPVSVTLEAFSPFAPLETRISSMPVAVFVFRVRNPGKQPVEVSVGAFLQNPVGYEADGVPDGIRHPQYGGNRNQVRNEGAATVLHMSAVSGRRPTLDRPLRLFTNLDPAALNAPFNDRPEQLTIASLASLRLDDVRAGDVLWLEDAPSNLPPTQLETLAEATRKGALLVFAGGEVPLLRSFGHVSQGKDVDDANVRPTILFEDFESGYEQWTVTGEAFGSAPASGTLPNQQRVSGFLGKGLVNSYLDGDGTTGRMVSRKFRIERRYIRFLVGGGSSPQTQIRLVVGGRVVRAASGRNEELLLPRSWDVSEFEGQEAEIHIVDEAKGGWGHINVDHIEFSDLPGDVAVLKALQELLPIRFSQVTRAPADPASGFAETRYTPLNLVPDAETATLSSGVRLASRPFGQGRVIVAMASLLPAGSASQVAVRQRAYACICEIAGARYTPPRGVHPGAPGLGELELVALTPGSTALRDTPDLDAAWRMFTSRGRFQSGSQRPSEPTPPGTSVYGAVASTVTLKPGQSVEIPFLLTWRYPNKYTRQGVWLGNHYAREWPTVGHVTREAVTRLQELRSLTELFRKTFYDSTLPCWFLDCITANIGIIRHVGVVFRLENGDIYGWEGSNGCCQPTCTHVWGYEQTLSRLFPELERDMRRIDFKHQQREDGGINNRTEVPSPPRPTGEFPFADGHASCILKAYREATNCMDAGWMREYWPHVKRAVEYLIRRDAAAAGGEPVGVLQDDQWNTYDEALHGVTTFISGYYLAALRAGEEWARRMGDVETAERFRSVFERGQKRLVELCWDGEYFRQHLPGYEKMPGEVGPGCMADQLIGQWWAHQLGLGYILPADRVKSALASVFRYNWMTDLTGWRHMPRAFAGDKDKGLMIVTWPKGGRPPHVMLYSDEVWTGIEYQVAAHLIYEGMAEKGFEIVRGARERYDGVPRPPIPRNPWNEIECGGHYARAMSSWSLLLAVTGFRYDAPSRSLHLAPRVTPERLRAFFCGPEGWGTVAQTREAGRQTNSLTVAHGKLALSTITLESAGGSQSVAVRLAGKSVPARFERTEKGLRIVLAQPLVVRAGQTLTITS